MAIEFDGLEQKLNDDWIHSFEDTDKLYKEYYKDDLYYINLKIIYINTCSEIDKIKQESFLMTKPNKILYEEIVEILKKNSMDNNKRYSLLSILKYNITLEPDEINCYLQKNYSSTFLTAIKNIDSITFEKSINMFHDLNDLILVLYEKTDEDNIKNHNNFTKKIYLRSSNNKKTIKKRYKD